MELPELGYEKERFNSDLDSEFLHCLICYNILREPVMCRNEYYFCRVCITKHLHSTFQSCPTFCLKLTVESLKEMYHEHKVCEFIRSNEIYHEHKVCEFRRSKCHVCENINVAIEGVKRKTERIKTRTANVDAKTENIAGKKHERSVVLAGLEDKFKNIEMNMLATSRRTMNIGTESANINRRVRRFETEIGETERISTAAVFTEMKTIDIINYNNDSNSVYHLRNHDRKYVLEINNYT